MCGIKPMKGCTNGTISNKKIPKVKITAGFSIINVSNNKNSPKNRRI